MDLLYLDNNASTPLLPAAWEAMRPYFFECSGNPASSHRAGRLARQALEDARERIAHCLDARPDEVLFTSGATEANNLALFGLCGDAPGHIVASPIEHPCVSEPIAELNRRGFTLSTLPVNSQGVVEADHPLVPPDTRLVAVMLANHETGAIQPIEKLASQVGDGALLHCDAAAAAGKMPISFRTLGVTSLTISGHKFHGPKGIGALVVRKNVALRPLFRGGHQQQGNRPGTEPVPLAVGMAIALEWACNNRDANLAKVRTLRQTFLDHLRTHAAPVVVNGPGEGGLPHTLNISFPGCAADVLLMNLDLAGIACSTGSACSSGSLLPSPVLKAMAVPETLLHSAMRFSLSSLLTLEEIQEAARRITLDVNRLRQDSYSNPATGSQGGIF